MYIYILLDTVLATDVNKYSLASARCQQRWQTNGELDLFLAVEQRTVGLSCTKPVTTKQQSLFWLVSQSLRMSAIFVGNCRLIPLAAYSGVNPVVSTVRAPSLLDVLASAAIEQPPLDMPAAAAVPDTQADADSVAETMSAVSASAVAVAAETGSSLAEDMSLLSAHEWLTLPVDMATPRCLS